MTFQAARKFVTMIFPASCLACGTELVPRQPVARPAPVPQGSTRVAANPGSFIQWQEEHWCQDCWTRLTQQSRHRCCEKCGARLTTTNPFPGHCALCHGQDLRFEQAIATGNYQGLLQELIIRMKGQSDDSLAFQLGQLLGYELIDADFLNFDLLVPVPSHWWRKLKKGFHAADVIAEATARLTGIPNSARVLRSVRRTKKQGTLSNQGRIANVRGAFAVLEKSEIAGKRILVIDDVMTSGATTSEIARILKRHRASQVGVAVVARGARVS